ncbi:hypothetical protein [Variovorax terrae]|uniref:Uncharacterized protein n=1 Tax=Variovorax terrae TaxID=2923278 RepID=A0A9X1VQR6_9BURK|nr:hypothetical protein [Variovorax terrae]MCJ0762086.1 hypothetical protein [Variovorax terrae]
MSRELLIEGLSDAIGFVGGALAGYGLGLLFGLNIFSPGYSNGTVAGIVLVGLGGGAGLQLARRWRRGRAARKE